MNSNGTNRNTLLWQLCLVALVFALACGFGYVLTYMSTETTPLAFVIARTPTAPAFTAMVTRTRALTPDPTVTLTPALDVTSSPFLSARLSTAQDPFLVSRLFLLARPLPSDAETANPNLEYLYGTTLLFTRPVQHGIDFDPNPRGAKIFAGAAGTVVVAGFDNASLCGQPDARALCGPDLNFYGNVVVIRLDQDFRNQAVYVLYGQLDSINVKKGDHVNAGDEIATLGSTGSFASQPQLHLELRIGVNDYAHTRNPGLWLAPLAGRGILAGAATDIKGQPLRGWSVEIYRAEEPEVMWLATETYQRDDKPTINADDELAENFVLPDMPAGKYIVVIKQNQMTFTKTVTIEDGEITFIPIGF